MPSLQPIAVPTKQPYLLPTPKPSCNPTLQPSPRPSIQPSRQPTGQLTRYPSSPSSQPSRRPSSLPSRQPVSCPSSQPSATPSCPSSQCRRRSGLALRDSTQQEITQRKNRAIALSGRRRERRCGGGFFRSLRCGKGIADEYILNNVSNLLLVRTYSMVSLIILLYSIFLKINLVASINSLLLSYAK